MTDPPRISVARIAKPRGNRGEVAADFLTDIPERFRCLGKVMLEMEGKVSLEVFLHSFWFHKNRVILKFQGIDSIDQAKQLVGYDVTIPESERVSLPSGTYYQDDLVGCSLMGRSGENYGRIVGVVQQGCQYLLKIEGVANEFLVPFAEKYLLEINLQERILRCDLPEGLAEL